MATVTRTGPAVGSGLRKSRLRLQMDRNDSSASSTVRFRIWIETSNVESWSISLTVYGGWSSGGQTTSSFSHGGSYGWSSAKRTLVYDSTRTFTRFYGSTTTVEGSAQLTGIGAGQSPVRAMGSNGISVTIPRWSINAPSAPTGVSRSRVNDSQHVLNWGASDTASAPIEQFRIQRHDGLRNNSWRTVTTFPASARSWVDYSTQSNTRYRYRIRSENSAGVSSWSTSSFISTTPPTQQTPSPVEHDGGDNLVTVSRGGANMNVQVAIEHSSATATGSFNSWNQIHLTSVITSKNGTVTLRHVGVDPTRRHRYRARMRNASDSPTLWGNYSGASAIMNLLAAPNAPTNVQPNGVTVDSAREIPVSWTHNSTDGTRQQQRQVRTRINGGSWNTTSESTAGSTTWNLSSARTQGGATTEIQVRTRGEHPNWSPWSAIASVYASDKPSATIVSPEEGEVLTGSSVHLQWDYFDPEDTAQAQWRATLYDEFDNTLEHRATSGQAHGVTFMYQLEDFKTYKVGVQVRDGDRLWSDEAISIFTTEFDLPPAPTFEPYFDPETGAVVINVSVEGAGEGQADAHHLQIWRSISDGPEVLLGNNLPLDTSFTDYLPHLMLPNYYRVVSVSELPSVASSAVIAVQLEAKHRKGWAYFNAGPGFQQIVRVRANANVQITQGRDKTLRKFAGRQDSVEFAGEHRNWEGSLSVRLAPSEPGHSTRDDVEDIIQLPAPICYRDVTFPTGNRVFVSLGEFSHGQEAVVSEGSIGFTRVADPEERSTRAVLDAGSLPGTSGEDGE